MTHLYKFDRKVSKNHKLKIAGVDESGRGPLAGPVVAAAVILPENFRHPGINDCKKLSPENREKYFKSIKKSAISIGISIVNNKTIDTLNIYKAALLAMKNAALKLSKKPELLIIDGPYKLKGIKIKQLPLIAGDSKSASVACASIIAKVTRDKIMISYDKKFPGYGFSEHKGYPTGRHYDALRKYGPCTIHRRSFRLK